MASGSSILSGVSAAVVAHRFSLKWTRSSVAGDDELACTSAVPSAAANHKSHIHKSHCAACHTHTLARAVFVKFPQPGGVRVLGFDIRDRVLGGRSLALTVTNCNILHLRANCVADTLCYTQFIVLEFASGKVDGEGGGG